MATKTEYYTENDDEDYSEGLSSTEFVGQTFTIGTVGINVDFLISSVDIKLKLHASYTASLVYAKIYEVDIGGRPTGDPISTGSGAVSQFSNTSAKWGNIQMSEVTLKKNSTYCLVISGSGIVGYWRADGTSPTYTGGNIIFSSDSGDTWDVDDTTDAMFMINGQDEDGILCSISDAIYKAGANANTTAINPLLVKQFINQAESKVNVLSRKNWIEAYPTLPTHTRYILNEATSNLAAGYIINYDDSGFTSGLEAQRKIDNLRKFSKEIIDQLKDVEIQEFIVKT